MVDFRSGLVTIANCPNESKPPLQGCRSAKVLRRAAVKDMIKTAVIGASGFVGRHLWRSYRQAFPDCVGTSFSNPAAGLIPFDIRTPNLPALRLEETGHQAVIITSAKPNVAFCEKEPQAACAVNVAGTLELIRQIGRTSMSVVFVSSDYVFDGSSAPYSDDAEIKPTTEYGRQKAQVEREIPSLAGNYLILRLSKIYGLDKDDGTLLTDIARALASGQEVAAASDQFFCPTYVMDLVAAIHAVQESGAKGIFNVASPESWSRYEIASALAVAMNVKRGLVKKIGLYDLPSMKGRPLNTTMKCARLRKATSADFTPLHDSIVRVATDWRS